MKNEHISSICLQITIRGDKQGWRENKKIISFWQTRPTEEDWYKGFREQFSMDSDGYEEYVYSQNWEAFLEKTGLHFYELEYDEKEHPILIFDVYCYEKSVAEILKKYGAIYHHDNMELLEAVRDIFRLNDISIELGQCRTYPYGNPVDVSFCY